MKAVSKIIRMDNFRIFIVLLALVAFFSAMSPQAFLNVGNFFMIMRQVSMMGITAVGMTLVMLVGGFDLSVGTMQGFSGVLVGALMLRAGVPEYASVALAVLGGGLIGIVNGLIVTQLGVNPFITTLGTMTIIKGVAFVYTGATPVTNFSDSFKYLGQGFLFDTIPIPVMIMTAIFALGILFLNKTYVGRYMYSVGGNGEASRLSGINVKSVKLLAFIICSALASLSGVILASRLNSGLPASGQGFEFDVITACVLGGVSLDGGEGKLTGVFLGVLIMGVLSNGLIIIGADEYYQWIVKGVVLIVAVAVDVLRTISKK